MTMTMETEAITVSDATLRIGGSTIVSGLSFSIKEGQVFGLLGPSGCGKSTTLRLISGLVKPTSGSISVFGVAAHSLAGEQRCVTTVWQSRALFPHMSVRENIEFPLKVKRVSKSEKKLRTEELALKLGLSDKLDRSVANLSGGEQQRVALGRALATRPRVLLLDEPFTGLDQKLKLRLQADLRDLQLEYNCTYVLVSHEHEDIFSLADNMAIIEKGQLVQKGSPKEIYSHPKSALVAESVGHKNLIPGWVRGVSEDRKYAFVDTGVGAWWARNWVSAVSNDPVYYVIHPLDIRTASHGDCTAEGTFKAKESMGRYEVLFLRLQAGALRREIRIERHEENEGAFPSMGASIKIFWSREDAFILPRSDEEAPGKA